MRLAAQERETIVDFNAAENAARIHTGDPRGLGWNREINPSLYDLYAKKLPWRGWAGAKSPEEKAYIRKVKARRGNAQGK